ncbi:broad specificity phosphatase PhoE [Humibacillus xanthopallidus]|uniref:Broad specificity phosphatase PhoE n=1 Tax=Humibacillus xanthopallidus TaxID=412689 RepID=A0A543PN06_9MICO|nr:histidine phosphatase family protein [Humibacillus xanthopallidus]TQN45427.1 broad specificity phosphatase PhoE [Humibacillus xanthopallidus]
MSASTTGMPADGTADAPELTVVHLMRHGEVHNPEGLLYGRLEGYRLSDLGQQMAMVVARHLGPNDITHVVASPLERAQQTAAPLAAAHELPIETDERVIEAANHFEGRSVGMTDLLHPRNWHLFSNPRKPSWGEPYEEIAERMIAAIEDVRRAAHGHEAVIVSHQLPIWTARNKLAGHRLWHDPRNRECTLASLTSLTYSGEELSSITYSEPAAALLGQASKSVGA